MFRVIYTHFATLAKAGDLQINQTESNRLGAFFLTKEPNCPNLQLFARRAFPLPFSPFSNARWEIGCFLSPLPSPLFANSISSLCRFLYPPHRYIPPPPSNPKLNVLPSLVDSSTPLIVTSLLLPPIQN